MRQLYKSFRTQYYGFKLYAFLILATAQCFFSSYSEADIYRFVTVDGVETFTDAPVNKDAKVVIKAVSYTHLTLPTKRIV